MKKSLFAILLSSLVLGTPLVWAHGEDKPGPHGGFIQMPGAFHTEIKLKGKSEVQVYLLDIEWKNPSVKDSAVKIVYDSGKKRVEARCSMEQLSFICRFPGVDLNQAGRLQVEATREKQKGNVVSYALPLSFQGSETKAPSHSHH